MNSMEKLFENMNDLKAASTNSKNSNMAHELIYKYIPVDTNMYISI